MWTTNGIPIKSPEMTNKVFINNIKIKAPEQSNIELNKVEKSKYFFFNFNYFLNFNFINVQNKNLCFKKMF